jgi:type IV pilus assembly protein PilQ
VGGSPSASSTGYGPRGGTNETQGGGLTSDIERSTRLILQGDRAGVSRALSILEQTDLRPQQVEIEARVVEISPEDASRIGVTWTTPGSIDIGLKSLGGFKTAVIPSGEISFRATLDFLITKNVAKLMANPRTVVQDNEDASIFIGDLLRYRVLREQTALGSPVYDIESVPVGITLLARPRVNTAGEITLKIHPAVSTPTNYIDGVPQISSREIDTTVRLKDGDTFAIGGLIRDDEIRTMSKLPFLGDLPFIGRLFRSDTKDRKRSEIVILLRARLVE